LRIIHRAGLEPWPKILQNLRASRETELAGLYPLHVVCAWIGNTERIAKKYYLLVSEEHFKMAAGADSAPNSALNHEGAQKTAQHRACTEHAPNEKSREISQLSANSSGFSGIGQYAWRDSNPQP
jgi:hypothetical protein